MPDVNAKETDQDGSGSSLCYAERSAFQECCEATVTPPVVTPFTPGEWAARINKCTCPTLDGVKVTGSTCPRHGFLTRIG